MSENLKNSIQIQVQDRKLGDEWAEWNGCIDQKEISFNSGKRLFIGFAVLALIILSLISLLVWYLIQPRILELSSFLAQIISVLGLGAIFIFAFWVFLNVLSIVLEKNLLLRIFRFEFSLTFLAPMVISLGNRFGVSKDRLFNSFIKVSNSLTILARNQFKTSKLLVLLPHCLQRTVRQQLVDLGKKYNVGVFIASGGTVARKIISEQRPKAVIAIACERDLILGIQEIFMKIPVLGIPNTRPEGPCKNTFVDFKEVENAIRFFLK